VQVRRFAVHLGRELVRDNIVDVAAMMAYYAVLAVFPMLVFVLTLAMLVLPDSPVNQGVAMATQTLPSDVAALLVVRIRTAMQAAGAGVAIGGLLIALWSASGGAVSLMTALNAMYDKRETRSWIRRHAIGLAVTLGVALLIVVALALLVIGPIAGHWVADRLGLGAAFDVGWTIARWVGAGLLVMVVWAICYKFLPDTDAPFRVFTPGAVAGVLVWLGISYLFGVYLGAFDRYEATYGALGTAIIFLTWIWLSNLALLFGAEINDVLADLRAGSDPGAARLADPLEHVHHGGVTAVGVPTPRA